MTRTTHQVLTGSISQHCPEQTITFKTGEFKALMVRYAQIAAALVAVATVVATVN